MAKPLSAYQTQMNGERPLADFIPYTAHVTPRIIVTKDGDYLTTWKVGGIMHETSDAEDIQRELDQLNILYRSMASSNVSVWQHVVRRKMTDRLEADFGDNGFCADLDSKYYDSLASNSMLVSELYITLIYRPAPTRAERVARKSMRRTVAEVLSDQQADARKLEDMAQEFESGLSRYDLTRLGGYQGANGVTYSSIIEFFNFLVCGEWQRCRIPNGPINSALGSGYVFVGAETVELRNTTGKRYGQMLDLKDYPEYSEPGLLTELLYLDFEFVITHSFSFKGRQEGVSFLKRQANQLRSSEDGSIQQIAEFTDAIDQLIQGRFAMGEYHFAMMVYGDTREAAKQNRADASSVIKNHGFIPAVIATAADAGYFSQLPCNWAYRPRVAFLTSLNFAGLAPLHNFACGKRDGNPWGQAVTMFQTPSRQPFYFNFHASPQGEDNFDQKLLANTRIIGASGTGKTVLLGWLLAQLQKYRTNAPGGFTTVFFDKDRGAEILIRAMGGRYLAVKNGQPTGFQPFQMEPTERNIQFLERWVAERCRGEVSEGARERLSASDVGRISHAVRTVMRMPKPMRSLTTCIQNITEGLTAEERDNSLVSRLKKWSYGNVLGWVADNPEDLLDFDGCANIGIDGTEFLDNELVRDAISSYLLHRMDEVIDGRRFAYFMDEAWKWVDGDSAAFSEFAGDKQLTIRKQNGFGVFATQMPSSLLNSPIGASLVQQCATEIYLPNPKADHDEYTKGFKVTEAEFEVIKNMPSDSRHFVVKQGANSALVRFNLSDVRNSDGDVVLSFSDALAVLSGSSDNIELLDAIRSEVGDDPADWLPVFHERRKARRKILSSEVKV